MSDSPANELLVFRKDGVDHLVQHELCRLADALCVGVQRLVVLAIESRAVSHELFPACARLDERHGDSLPETIGARSRPRPVHVAAALTDDQASKAVVG